jgi:hypothetical protein
MTVAHRNRWTWSWPPEPLLLFGLPLGVILAFIALHYSAGAESDCNVLEAGGRFWDMLFVWPATSIALWAGYVVPVVLLPRRWRATGVVLGVAVAIGLAYWYVSGTASLIRVDPDGAIFCPSGVPTWWPSWLPR